MTNTEIEETIAQVSALFEQAGKDTLLADQAAAMEQYVMAYHRTRSALEAEQRAVGLLMKLISHERGQG